MARKPTKSKRFKYNLQTLLNVREIRETQAKDEYNEAERRLEEEKEKEIEKVIMSRWLRGDIILTKRKLKLREKNF